MKHDFKNYGEAYKEESDIRHNIDPDKLCTYGVKPLDDAMIAIAPDELVVIGAMSGYGKSELALAISRHNALRGKKVAHYHLEGGYMEAVRRMKWKDICDMYFRHHKGAHIDLDYRNWSLNKNPCPLLLQIESKVYTDLKDKLSDKLYFYNNPEGLTCDKFLASLMSFHNLIDAFKSDNPFKRITGVDLDLIVIDHLQYFSFEKDENEIFEITRILKEAKKITETYKIPVILVSHFRKLPRGHGIPDKEDLYGTSNIHKVADTCVIIHPDHENDKSYEGIYPTYMRIAKSRIGIRPSDLAYINFDIQTRSYQDHYDMVKCFSNGSVASDMTPEHQKPKWARTNKFKESMVFGGESDKAC